MMKNCYNCQAEISDESIFCKKCGRQLKCRKCENDLDDDAKFCMACGEQVSINNKNENKAINNIEFNQKGKEKNFKANFTDEVGVYLAGAFNSLVTGQPLTPKNPFQKSFPSLSNRNSTALGKAANKNDNIEDAEIIDDFGVLISKIFKETETGKLEIIDNRLKEKSKLDKMKRLVVVFLYAKKLTDIESVSREELNEIVSREKLSDGNYRNFISKDGLKYFSVKENGNLSLLMGGEDYAKEILRQIADPNFNVTTSKAGRKSGKKSNNFSAGSHGVESKGNQSNPTALIMCKTLLTEGYFNEKRKLNDVVNYCDQKKATKYSPQNLQYSLNRMIKDQILDREKNADSQYEYWKK